MKDVENSQLGLQDIRVFGAYFNSNDELLLTENAVDMLQKTKQQFNDSHHVILTLINDYVTENAPSVQKDSTLLHRLLQDTSARQKHIGNILRVVEQYQINGIEIDYEKVAKDDLQNYILFLEELYQELSKKDVTLHVVLEPRFPFDVKLPDGPHYTVMAYNVHGYHSGPGAKATFSFLDDLVKKMKKSNQASGAVYFSYVDDNNVSHEVWYADQETLEKWVTYVQKKSYHDVVLWRAGGLGEKTIEWIAEQSTE